MSTGATCESKRDASARSLLRKEEKTVGRYDSRFQGIDLDNVGEYPEYDPSYAIVQGPFTALVNQYLRNELKYETDLTYRVLTGKVQPWSYGRADEPLLECRPEPSPGDDEEPFATAVRRQRQIRSGRRPILALATRWTTSASIAGWRNTSRWNITLPGT